MNARMLELIDLLAQRERQEEPGYVEILPPLATEIEPQITACLVTIGSVPSEDLVAA